MSPLESASPLLSPLPKQQHERERYSGDGAPLVSAGSSFDTALVSTIPPEVVVLKQQESFAAASVVTTTETCSLTTVSDENTSLVSDGIIGGSDVESPTLNVSTSNLSSSCSDTKDLSINGIKNTVAGDVLGVAELAVQPWNRRSFFSDLIQQGLHYQQKLRDNTAEDDQVIMLYESPTATSSSASDAGFYNNCQVYKFHDYPKSHAASKAVLVPCRYSLMNGATYPSYMQELPPQRLLEHWKGTIPNFVEPTFVTNIDKSALVYAYLPMEHIQNHLNDPHVHYHLAGKDAIRLMTDKTTQLYSNTQDTRPCICKTTHSMGSKGIFVIRNDDDEAEFQKFIQEAGNPNFIITEFVEVAHNVACHFFINPDGSVVWFGSNENRRVSNKCTKEDSGTDDSDAETESGDVWSTDSYIVMSDQDDLRELQLPFVKDVVQYCRSFGFWGCCGIDVLVDTNGKGYLVDVNPRVTGSCPALMVSYLLQEQYGFEYCLFRRCTQKYAFPGSADMLLRQVEEFNEVHRGSLMIVVYSFYELSASSKSTTETLVNIGVHGRTSMEDCERVLNEFVPSVVA